MHRNHCMPQLICLMSLALCSLINWKNRPFASLPSLQELATWLSAKKQWINLGEVQIGKKIKSPDFSLLLLNITSHHAFIYRKWFFLVHRFYGTGLPLPPRCLGHAWINFRLSMAHTFSPEVENVTVDLIAEDWAMRVIDFKMAYENMPGCRGTQAFGMLPLADMLLSAWASPKNQISQDPLSLSQINSSIRKSPYSIDCTGTI